MVGSVTDRESSVTDFAVGSTSETRRETVVTTPPVVLLVTSRKEVARYPVQYRRVPSADKTRREGHRWFPRVAKSEERNCWVFLADVDIHSPHGTSRSVTVTEQMRGCTALRAMLTMKLSDG